MGCTSRRPYALHVAPLSHSRSLHRLVQLIQCLHVRTRNRGHSGTKKEMNEERKRNTYICPFNWRMADRLPPLVFPRVQLKSTGGPPPKNGAFLAFFLPSFLPSFLSDLVHRGLFVLLLTSLAFIRGHPMSLAALAQARIFLRRHHGQPRGTPGVRETTAACPFAEIRSPRWDFAGGCAVKSKKQRKTHGLLLLGSTHGLP